MSVGEHQQPDCPTTAARPAEVRLRAELGAALRSARRSVGMTGVEAAARVLMHHTRLSRIELGQLDIRPDEAEVLLEVLQPDPVLRQTIEVLMDRITNPGRLESGQPVSGLAFHQEMWKPLEAGTYLQWFDPGVCVPSLLQTTSYIQAIFRERSTTWMMVGDEPRPIEEVQDIIRFRIGLQRMLFEPHRRFRFIIYETAFLLGMLDASGMAFQCHHVAQLSLLPNVEVYVVPIGTVLPVIVESPFCIVDEAFAHADVPYGVTRVTSRSAFDYYVGIFESVRSVSVSGDEARDVLRRRAVDLLARASSADRVRAEIDLRDVAASSVVDPVHRGTASASN